MRNTDITSIYNNHINDLYSYALHLGFDEDIIMDAIHDVFLNMCKTDKKIKEITNIKFFLFRSLKNRLLNLSRNKERIVDFPINPDLEKLPFDIHVTIDELLITKEEHEITRQKIEEMLNLLTPRQREIIYLRYAQEYDYEQIAQLMNISVPACRKLVHRALTIIREKYPIPLFFLFLEMMKMLKN